MSFKYILGLRAPANIFEFSPTLKPHCLMIMVLQVGEQGQAPARAVGVVVRLLFHAVSISAAAAGAARAPARVLYLAPPESGWAAGRVGAPDNPNPPLMSGMAASFSLSLLLYLSRFGLPSRSGWKNRNLSRRGVGGADRRSLSLSPRVLEHGRERVCGQ